MLYLHTEDMVGPEIHDFLLDDQLTVDFIHQKQIFVQLNLDLRCACWDILYNT